MPSIVAKIVERYFATSNFFLYFEGEISRYRLNNNHIILNLTVMKDTPINYDIVSEKSKK
jgi:hypothetical protein